MANSKVCSPRAAVRIWMRHSVALVWISGEMEVPQESDDPNGAHSSAPHRFPRVWSSRTRCRWSFLRLVNAFLTWSSWRLDMLNRWDDVYRDLQRPWPFRRQWGFSSLCELLEPDEKCMAPAWYAVPCETLSLAANPVCHNPLPSTRRHWLTGHVAEFILFLQHDPHRDSIFHAFDVKSGPRFAAEPNDSHGTSILILPS